MALFTTENAATMAQRRWDAEREAKANPRILPAPILNNAEQTPIEAEVVRVRGQLEQINQQLDACEEPDEWDCLTRSKERLFRIWARLAQFPTDPKPSSKPAQARHSTVQPIGPAPQPAVVPPTEPQP